MLAPSNNIQPNRNILWKEKKKGKFHYSHIINRTMTSWL